jgi:Fur family zinc uptake transcriptional regulator
MNIAESLTPLRRDVLDLIKRSPKPVKAYDLLRELSLSRERAAPPTVYRALNFLVGHGLIHRVEALHAFLACPNPSTGCDHVFLICERCGQVADAEGADAARLLREACADARFAPASVSQEVRGLCAACASAGDS